MEPDDVKAPLPEGRAEVDMCPRLPAPGHEPPFPVAYAPELEQDPAWREEFGHRTPFEQTWLERPVEYEIITNINQPPRGWGEGLKEGGEFTMEGFYDRSGAPASIFEDRPPDPDLISTQDDAIYRAELKKSQERLAERVLRPLAEKCLKEVVNFTYDPDDVNEVRPDHEVGP